MAEAPYGSWRSPVTIGSLTQEVVELRHPLVVGDRTYWVEGRPNEAGRQVIVRMGPDAAPEDVIATPYSARSRVHEYGGLGYAVAGESVFFANFADQRVYRVDGRGDPVAITPAPTEAGGTRYACPFPTAGTVVWVRERHAADGVRNDLVAVPLEGGEPQVLAGGRDFYSAPTVSPDGHRLAWLCWDHPNMPWDGTELYEGVLEGTGVANATLVAGGPNESVSQPRYAPDGRLHFVSDRTGWWNLYAADGPVPVALYQAAEEFSGPDWQFGQASYAFLPDGTLVASWTDGGIGHLGVLGSGHGQESGHLREIRTEFTSFDHVRAVRGGVIAVVGSPTSSPQIAVLGVPGGEVTVVKSSRPSTPGPSYLSRPRPLTFPTGSGQRAHALYYPPTNPDFSAPPSELPPLIVMSHGGPTSAASSVLDYDIQLWTSRGMAVVDVDYGGSTGYGRAYRERLRGNWGVVDVDDCVNATTYLAELGLVDTSRTVIRGKSAGGYTTLCALTFRRIFAAGASYFGVADVAALARDTHKFEARYLDSLIGPWPEARARYEERSPIHHVDQLATPMILFQGLEDRVVPPSQAEIMAGALDTAEIPYAYVTFAEEQHGFRKAENIELATEAELSFYAQVLGFEPADVLQPVPIRHADRLPANREPRDRPLRPG